MSNQVPELTPLREFASAAWQSRPVGQRCKLIAAARHVLADAANDFIATSRNAQRTSPIDTVAAELIPLCDALLFLAKQGPAILRTRKYGPSGRPIWLWGVRSQVQRSPWGIVLVLGAWNYPLLLGGVQVAQALAAGNAVLWKPAPGSEQVCQQFAAALQTVGLPTGLLTVLDSSVATATAALDAGVDLVVLTGSARTGRAVLQRAAQCLTPAVMELSGSDAVIVMASADLKRAAQAIRFGLTINSGASCIGPRRLILQDTIADIFVRLLREELRDSPEVEIHPAARADAADLLGDAIARGGVSCLANVDQAGLTNTGRMRPVIIDHVCPDWPITNSDVFAPVATIQRFAGLNQAADICNACGYALAASIFAAPREARQLASCLRVGSVTIGDLIVPTADPRLPFGGRRGSGYGVTRGREGLLQMTTPKVVSVRRGRFAPHLRAVDARTLPTLLGALQISHAKHFGGRLRGLWRIIRTSIGSES